MYVPVLPTLFVLLIFRLASYSRAAQCGLRGRECVLMIVAFKVYDMDRDGYISNGELFLVLKMMVGNNLKDQQLQQVPTPFLTNLTLDRRQDNYGSR
jgi:hypothetical protein